MTIESLFWFCNSVSRHTMRLYSERSNIGFLVPSLWSWCHPILCSSSSGQLLLIPWKKKKKKRANILVFASNFLTNMFVALQKTVSDRLFLFGTPFEKKQNPHFFPHFFFFFTTMVPWWMGWTKKNFDFRISIFDDSPSRKSMICFLVPSIKGTW